jgi:hypothetical protein
MFQYVLEMISTSQTCLTRGEQILNTVWSSYPETAYTVRQV